MEDLYDRVETDLKSRGFQLTPALQYGFDLAAYDGSPLKTHSLFLVHIVRPKDIFHPLDLIKAGRLANTVRKYCLLAVPTKDNIRYLKLSWWDETN